MLKLEVAYRKKPNIIVNDKASGVSRVSSTDGNILELFASADAICIIQTNTLVATLHKGSDYF